MWDFFWFAYKLECFLEFRDFCFVFFFNSVIQLFLKLLIFSCFHKLVIYFLRIFEFISCEYPTCKRFFLKY